MNSDPSSPEQNIVITENRDWTDLPEAMHELLTDDDKAKRIADHSYEFWRYYLSSASINCYWRRMFHAYASSLNTPVKRSEHAPSYASFNLMGKTRWDPS